MTNYPPGVTGNEYAIGGAQSEWEADATCPHCGWEGPMLHEAHYEFGIRAFCANPDLIEVKRVDLPYDSFTFERHVCPLATEGFTIEMDYPEEPELHE